jgi:23S rRNA pseudouridine2605 synthase
MVIDGYEILPVKTTVISVSNGSTVLEMTLYEGRNRQIRKMCESQNLKITRLCRVALGSIELGSLGEGKWRYLSEDELRTLGVGNAK